MDDGTSSNMKHAGMLQRYGNTVMFVSNMVPLWFWGSRGGGVVVGGTTAGMVSSRALLRMMM